MKIVRETLEALFDLHLGIPEEVVAAAGQGLDSFLQRCCSQAATVYRAVFLILASSLPAVLHRFMLLGLQILSTQTFSIQSSHQGARNVSGKPKAVIPEENQLSISADTHNKLQLKSAALVS